ncbi:MAG: enoyl-CoA hydratase family protein [Pseudomonadota bacterium]
MTARLEDAGDRLIIWNGNTKKRGALSLQLYECIAEAMLLAQEARIRAVILTSEGPFFCAGGDLTVLIERRGMSEAERCGKIEDLHDLIRAMRACPVPLIAAVEGGAAGAGLSFALACDFVVAAKDAQFTAAYVKAGLVPDGGLTASLARLIPRSLAMEMCLMGRPVMAARFAELGAISRLCAPGSTMEEAMALADALTKGPRNAQRAIRALVAQAYDVSEQMQLDAERDAMGHASGQAEAAEGIAAFLEKRHPVFR